MNAGFRQLDRHWHIGEENILLARFHDLTSSHLSDRSNRLDRPLTDISHMHSLYVLQSMYGVHCTCRPGGREQHQFRNAANPGNPLISRQASLEQMRSPHAARAAYIAASMQRVGLREGEKGKNNSVWLLWFIVPDREQGKKTGISPVQWECLFTTLHDAVDWSS